MRSVVPSKIFGKLERLVAYQALEQLNVGVDLHVLFQVLRVAKVASTFQARMDLRLKKFNI